eukprot:1510906-Pyramimonas_sp.AAC.1
MSDLGRRPKLLGKARRAVRQAIANERRAVAKAEAKRAATKATERAGISRREECPFGDKCLCCDRTPGHPWWGGAVAGDPAAVIAPDSLTALSAVKVGSLG